MLEVGAMAHAYRMSVQLQEQGDACQWGTLCLCPLRECYLHLAVGPTGWGPPGRLPTGRAPPLVLLALLAPAGRWGVSNVGATVRVFVHIYLSVCGLADGGVAAYPACGFIYVLLQDNRKLH